MCRLTFVSSAAHTDVPGTSTVIYIPVPTSVVLLLSFSFYVKHEDAGENNKEDRDKENDRSFQTGKPFAPPTLPVSNPLE